MIDELLSKERLKNQTQPQIRDRLRLSRSFQKLLATTDSATVLTKMALSPHLRSIFLDFEFKPVYLPEDKGLVPSTNVDLWMSRLQAMSISGSRSEDGKQTQGRGEARGSEDVEETRGSEVVEEIGSGGGEQTCGSQGSGGACGSEDVEESCGSEDGKNAGLKGGEENRGSQGSGGARDSEDVEGTRGSQDGEENGPEDIEQTRGSQGSRGPRGFEDVEETRGPEDGEQTHGSQGCGWARGSEDGEETREPGDGKKTKSENGEETHGSENGREARRSRVDMRSELINCIKEAISVKVKCQVHAEVRVLGYLHRHGLIDKAINSVGISKLCCPACLAYISVMDIAIQVGGTHNKWYPWHLCLDDELLSLDQLRLMKENILRDFKLDWMKHLLDLRQRLLSFGNHSESSSGDAELEDGMNVFKMSYDIDKVKQGEYIKELEESVEYSLPKQLVRSDQRGEKE